MAKEMKKPNEKCAINLCGIVRLSKCVEVKRLIFSRFENGSITKCGTWYCRTRSQIGCILFLLWELCCMRRNHRQRDKMLPLFQARFFGQRCFLVAEIKRTFIVNLRCDDLAIIMIVRIFFGLRSQLYFRIGRVNTHRSNSDWMIPKFLRFLPFRRFVSNIAALCKRCHSDRVAS